MDSRKFILRKTAVLALGEVICCAVMVGLFALLGYFSYKVVVGGILGLLLAVGNFFFMAIASDAAADKAVEQDVKTGKSILKASYGLRLVILGVLLIVFAKSGHCNLITLVCPLVFSFPILMVTEFFRKSGDAKS